MLTNLNTYAIILAVAYAAQICGCGGIGRRARLCFIHLGERIVDYGFSVFIDED